MERRMEGFGLIEVLVSMLILGVGILGMIGLQLNALQFNQTAAFRSHATFLAYDIADRMRANAPAALAGSYRSEEHTSELQSLMRISYACFCLTNKKYNRCTTCR